MASLTDQQRDENRTRRLRKAQRAAARDAARNRVAEAIRPLVASDAPEWLTEEQASAYREELLRQIDRFGVSRLDPYHRTLKPSRACARSGGRA